jgi:16S rRNA (guanine527-N7)-methyltransferase
MTFELFEKVFFDHAPDQNVSRETLKKFFHFSVLLEKYKISISMIRYRDLDDLVCRHFIDSYQLSNIIPKNSPLVDLGSGAGFPSVVLSIMGYDVTAIESNFKKSFFLNEVARELGLSLKVINGRIEDCKQKFDFITARALSSLVNLLDISQNVSRETSHAFFLKGQNTEKELSEASKVWHFERELIASSTNAESNIVHIWDWKKNGTSYCNS